MDEREAAGLGRELGLRLPADTTARLTRQTDGWPALLALATLGARTPEGGADVDRRRLRSARRGLPAVRGPRGPLRDRDRVPDPHLDPRAAVRAALRCRDRATRIDLCPAAACTVDPAGGRLRRVVSLSHAPARLPPARARGPRARDGGHPPSASRRPGIRRTTPYEPAVDHAFAAGDLDLAATLVGNGWQLFHWSGRRATIRSWAARFGADALEARPWLAVLAAWEEIAAGDVARDDALRGCRRAWNVRGQAARRHGFLRGRACDAPGRHGSARRRRRAGERHPGGRARRGPRLLAGLRALAAGLRAPHGRRPGRRRRGLGRRGRRGQIVGRRRGLVLRARAPRARGRRTGRLGCRGCPHRGERRDRPAPQDRRVPLERPVSRRPHQADDPPRGYRRGASRARSRDGPATTPDRRGPGRGRPVPPRVRPRPPRGRRPGRRARSRRAGAAT